MAEAQVAKIRVVALGVIRNGDRIFVYEGHDPVKGETFYRPLGGTVEFGERAEDAVIRELDEEIGVRVTRADHLGTIENIFTFAGRAAHELDFIFEVTIEDVASLSDRGEFYEANGEWIACMWKPLADFRNGARLYPDGLLRLLE